MYQKVFYGPIRHEENGHLVDIGGREQIALWPLVALALIMGVASPLWMKSIDPAVAQTITPAQQVRSAKISNGSPAGAPVQTKDTSSSSSPAMK
jgi:NADH-quinone oxidoreductase subunit M